ncbi:MAG: HAD-IB family hydrolase [Synechococcales cyanobacterium RU_4_20]|nr:HAD-IB family hydrolase [Synechococcales cyanobacterium RU_4_20]
MPSESAAEAAASVVVEAVAVAATGGGDHGKKSTAAHEDSSIKETLISQYFDGFDITQLETAGLRFATESLDQWLNPQALERLCWHQAQGHRVVIVSANLEVYLKPWAARYGIAEDDVIASKLALNAEAKITGKLEGNSCYGPEKVSRLEATLGPLDQYYLYAYGDSKGDRELLACADEPFYRSFAQGGSPWIR